MVGHDGVHDRRRATLDKALTAMQRFWVRPWRGRIQDRPFVQIGSLTARWMRRTNVAAGDHLMFASRRLRVIGDGTGGHCQFVTESLRWGAPRGRGVRRDARASDHSLG